MSFTTANNGRLCNQIIRDMAASFIAEKFDLHVSYASKTRSDLLGIPLFCGSQKHNDTIKVENRNYFEVLNKSELNSNINLNEDYFQFGELTVFIYNYLNSIKDRIIEKNPFKKRYNKNNDCVIHIRLTDVEKNNPGVDYYINAIQRVGFDNLYIVSDNLNHKIIRTITKKYPNAKLIDCDEIFIIQFASTCKTVVLSHGSFSTVIGYLSFFSNVLYPKIIPEKQWFGDTFTAIDAWTQINY